jgi:hypothetical protein
MTSDELVAQVRAVTRSRLRSLSGEPAKIGKKGDWLAGDRFDQLKRRVFP